MTDVTCVTKKPLQESGYFGYFQVVKSIPIICIKTVTVSSKPMGGGEV